MEFLEELSIILSKVIVINGFFWEAFIRFIIHRMPNTTAVIKPNKLSTITLSLNPVTHSVTARKRRAKERKKHFTAFVCFSSIIIFSTFLPSACPYASFHTFFHFIWYALKMQVNMVNFVIFTLL